MNNDLLLFNDSNTIQTDFKKLHFENGLFPFSSHKASVKGTKLGVKNGSACVLALREQLRMTQLLKANISYRHFTLAKTDFAVVTLNVFDMWEIYLMIVF